jgi:PadR family transcriptional regulator, regulatory protein PadR
MAKTELLGGFQILILGAIGGLKDRESGVSYASGVAVRKEILAKTGKVVSLGAVYTTLDRLAKQKFIDSEVSDRVGNRPMRFHYLTGDGQRALAETRQATDSMLAWLVLPAVDGGLT